MEICDRVANVCKKLPRDSKWRIDQRNAVRYCGLAGTQSQVLTWKGYRKEQWRYLLDVWRICEEKVV